MNTAPDDTFLNALRAIDDMRRHLGFAMSSKDGVRSFLSIEFIDNNMKLPKARMAIITGSRAHYLGLAKEKSEAFAVDASGLSAAQCAFLADPLAVKTALPPLAGRVAGETEILALKLAKQASVLPALLAMEGVFSSQWQTVPLEEARRYIEHPPIEVVETARAKLPIEGAENTSIVSFRLRCGDEAHLSLLIGAPELGKTPLVRVHSSCVTGDILGSLRCDCGSQLQLAMDQIVAEGSGILLYLHQEGRGIGITNKLRAYALQEQGVDTYDANLMLGFDEDERDFAIAAAMLKHLGVTRCRLLTNNPSKVENLKRYGIDVAERLSLAIKSGRHNHAYLDAKAKKSGHLF